MEDSIKSLKESIAQIQREISATQKEAQATLAALKNECAKTLKQEEVKSYARGVADTTKRVKAEEAWLANAKKEFDKMYDAKLKAEEVITEAKAINDAEKKAAEKVQAAIKKAAAKTAEKTTAKKEVISAKSKTAEKQPSEEETSRNDIYGYREISFEEDSLLGEDHDFLMEEEEESAS